MNGGIGTGAVLLVTVAACASAPSAKPAAREIVMAYDDAHTTGTVAFPNETYESVVRFQLPDGEHKPLRLRFQAEAPGQLEITIYDSTVLETPGDAIHKVTRDLAKEDLSNGKDGRWVVEDLIGREAAQGRGLGRPAQDRAGRRRLVQRRGVGAGVHPQQRPAQSDGAFCPRSGRRCCAWKSRLKPPPQPVRVAGVVA